MFSQRKSFLKSRWYVFVIIAFLAVGYLLSQNDNNPPESTPPDKNQSTPIVDQPVIEQKEIRPETKERFYLLKESNGKVDVYYYEDRGEPVFVKNTEIEFSLLSNEDQAMLTEGIMIETEEELRELLQDFES